MKKRHRKGYEINRWERNVRLDFGQRKIERLNNGSIDLKWTIKLRNNYDYDYIIKQSESIIWDFYNR